MLRAQEDGGCAGRTNAHHDAVHAPLNGVVAQESACCVCGCVSVLACLCAVFVWVRL